MRILTEEEVIIKVREEMNNREAIIEEEITDHLENRIATTQEEAEVEKEKIVEKIADIELFKFKVEVGLRKS